MSQRYTNRELKTKALELLEWALDDMSPEGGSKLHLKCGFEREGHFVTSANACTDSCYMESLTDDMQTALLQKKPELSEVLDCVYHDSGGTFIIEAVTKPLGLLQATRAIDDISNTMLTLAPHLGCEEYGFGDVAALCVDRLLEHLDDLLPLVKEKFVQYDHEVFEIEGKSKVLAGRGQHCNLSIWLGDEELLRHTGKDSTDLVNLATIKTMEWMPSMFMPCRRGNYHRIAADSPGASKDFLAGDLKGQKMPFILRYTADQKQLRAYADGTYRLEYRAGAAEADPYDLALAAAAPLVKTCEETMPRDKGKIIIDNSGMVYTEGKYRPFPERSFGKAPTSETEAAEAFNKPDNPYFAYLNELAERKIARMEEKQKANPSPVNNENLREATKLRGIGDELFIAYCQEYGLEPCHSTGRSGLGIR